MRALTFISLISLACLSSAVALAQSPPAEERVPLATSDELSPPDAALPEKIELPPSPESAPTVSIRSLDNGDRVEEYRMNGRLYEVRVTPRVGPPYALLDTNGDGKLDRRDTDGPVAPVYWTLYSWN